MYHFLFFIFSIAHAWNTVYSYPDGKIYVHLSNNDLVALNFSLSGVSDSTELKDGQKVLQMPTPPANSTIFVSNGDLYALTGPNLTLMRSHDSQWSRVALDTSDLSDSRYYREPTVLSDMADNSTVYVYGGFVDGSVSSRMVSIDMDTLHVSNISTSTTPQPFYGAAVALAPGTRSSVVIGGQSNEGWLSMYQLATWSSVSGWSFQKVQKPATTGTTVSVRKRALALPVFRPGHELDISSVAVIGGEMASGEASPSYVSLVIGDEWAWNTTNASLDVDSLGFAAIFNSLVAVSGTSGNYTVSLHDVHTLQRVTTLSENYARIVVSSDRRSVKRAIIGVVVPLCGLALIGVAGGIAWRHHKKKRQMREQQEEMREIEDRFAVYQPNPFRKESLSTLGESFESWNKKRNEYIGSKETLIERTDGKNGEERVNEGDERVNEEDRDEGEIESEDPFGNSEHEGLSRTGSYSSFDGDMDVQVLVSSKRRSVLRVVNPDVDETTRFGNRYTEVRQRVSSNK